jgi:hypothetical protein
MLYNDICREDVLLSVNSYSERRSNMKYEIARELGVSLGADTTSRMNGSVGGEMTKRLVELGKANLR